MTVGGKMTMRLLLLSLFLLFAACTVPPTLPTVTPVSVTPDATPTREAPTPTLTFTTGGEWNVNCLETEQQRQVETLNPCLSQSIVKHLGDFSWLQPAEMEVIPRANVYGETGINMRYTAGITYYLGQGVAGTGRSWTGIVDTIISPVTVEANVCYVALTFSYADIWPHHVDPDNTRITQAYAVNVILHLDYPEEGREVALNEQGLYEVIERIAQSDFYDMVGNRTRLFPFWTRSDGYTVLPVHRFIGRYGEATPESTWTLQALAILRTEDAGGQGLCQGVAAF